MNVQAVLMIVIPIQYWQHAQTRWDHSRAHVTLAIQEMVEHAEVGIYIERNLKPFTVK